MNTEILNRLKLLADGKYKEFQSRLLPTIAKDKILGVRMPDIRRLAVKLAGGEDAEKFLSELPHSYYDEDNLHAALLEKISDFDECIAALDAFLPHVDNWATCDSINPRVLRKYPRELLPHILRYISSDKTYTVRYGIGLLMRYYLDENFSPEYPELAANIKSNEYYVNMMISWYFATALSKKYDEIIPYIEERRLSPWIHKKTIQKAVESYRISTERKEYLKKFR